MSSNNDTNRRRTKSTTQLQTNNGKLRPQSVANRRPTPVSIPSGSAGRRISSCSAPPHELALAACNETKSYDDLAVNSGFQRVRSFATKAGTVVNRGDSFRIRKVANKSDLEIDLEKRDSLESFDKRAGGRNSKSNLRHGEDGSEASNAIGRGRIMNSRQKKSDEIEGQTNRRSIPDQHRQQTGSVTKTDEESTSSVYNILVLGSHGVGKTTLVQQLMTSEYLANKETCYDGKQ